MTSVMEMIIFGLPAFVVAFCTFILLPRILGIIAGAIIIVAMILDQYDPYKIVTDFGRSSVADYYANILVDAAMLGALAGVLIKLIRDRLKRSS